MPTTKKAAIGDTLCTLAMEAGFLNCQPLRDEPANAGLLNRDLLPDVDIVTIPDLVVQEVDGSAETTHEFVAQNSPPVSIRFVHGSPNTPYREDADLDVLNISNYRTDKGGKDALSNFPKEFEFHQEGHDDPDTFKVEVVDPAAGAEVVVRLDRLKPVFDADGTLVKLLPLTDDTAKVAARKFRCKAVRSKVSFRSRYLRLVADTDDMFPDGHVDLDGIDGQGFLADAVAQGDGTGLPTDDDAIEIFDMPVRASYTIQRCPAPDPNKCTVRATIPVGEDRLKVRVQVHVFRPGKAAGDKGFGLVTAVGVRRRICRLVRDYYAQANMCPKLIEPGVDFIDPPDDNMLVIGQDTGQGTGSKKDTLELTIFGDAILFGVQILKVPLDPRMTPKQIGDAVVAALGTVATVVPGTLVGTAFDENPRAFNAKNGSCDVLITATDGSSISLEATADTDILKKNLVIARVNLNNVNGDNKANSVISLTPDLRRIVRARPGAAGQVNIYVVGDVITTAMAITFIPGQDLKAGFQSIAPFANCVVSRNVCMDITDENPYVISHEMGHALTDGFHTTGSDPHSKSELMNGDPENNSREVNSPKRISDDPVRVSYDLFDSRQLTTGAAHSVRVFAVQHFRTRNTAITE